jgi:integrase
MQNDSLGTPAAKLAAIKKTHPSKASPIGRDISDAKLRALKPAEKAYRQAVGGGLYLEVMPTGSKLWRWKYRLDGRENRFAIGKYPRISLVQAPEAVEQARKLVQEGRHPSLQKKIDGFEATRGRRHTLEDLTKEWLGLKTWEDITKTRRLNMMERVVFPKLGALPIRQITPPMILDVLKTAAAKNGISVMAEAKRTLFGIFEFAHETFRVDSNPVHRWRDALPKNKTQHKAPLSKADIGQLLRDLDTHGGSYQIQAAFLLMWLTLARPSEVVEAQWSEFDLDLAIWRIPAERMKKRREHVVPLPRQALSLLRGMQTVTGHRQHVFPHRDNRNRPMVVASFRQMLHVLGWSGKFSPHATRTTGSTRLNEMGASADWIERQLAHAEPNRVRATYNHADYFTARAKMMQDWADLLDDLKAGKSNVVSISREVKRA